MENKPLKQLNRNEVFYILDYFNRLDVLDYSYSLKKIKFQSSLIIDLKEPESNNSLINRIYAGQKTAIISKETVIGCVVDWDKFEFSLRYQTLLESNSDELIIIDQTGSIISFMNYDKVLHYGILKSPYQTDFNINFGSRLGNANQPS